MKQINVDVSQKSNNSKVPKNLDTISQIIGEIDENALYFVDVNSKSFTVTHKQLVSQILESVLKNIPQVEGVGISKIEKTSTEGLVDTYAVILTDGSTYYFTITNGKDGISATHSWNGTTLTITSASGTSSADLKGPKGDNGNDYILTNKDKNAIAEQTKELIDLSSYQPKTDESLETESKEISGAINEVNETVNNTKDTLQQILDGDVPVDYAAYADKLSYEEVILKTQNKTTLEAINELNNMISREGFSVTDLTETTWNFPDTLEDKIKLSETVSYNINFTNGVGALFSAVEFYCVGGKIQKVYYTDEFNEQMAVYNAVELSGGGKGWIYGDAYQTITILGGDDATNPDFIKLLYCLDLQKVNVWSELELLRASITGNTWVLKDKFEYTSEFEKTYDFNFVSNGTEFNQIKIVAYSYMPGDEEIYGYTIYIYYVKPNGTLTKVYDYGYFYPVGWIDTAYQTIVTDDIDISLDDIATKTKTTITKRLATKSKTVVGAINELNGLINITFAYRDPETGDWYKDEDLSEPLTTINLTGINFCIDVLGEGISWQIGEYTIDLTNFVLKDTKVGQWVAALFEKGADVGTAIYNIISETEVWKQFVLGKEAVMEFLSPVGDTIMGFGHAIDEQINNFIQEHTDENLETENKSIVPAINELDGKYTELSKKIENIPTPDTPEDSNLATIDKIDSIALTNYDAQSISTTNGLVWRDDSTFTVDQDDYDNIPTTHRVPIVAGENVTFEVDEENQVVKINATGGGSSENSILSVTVETDYPTTMFAIIEAIQSAGGDLSKLTFVTLTGYTTCNLMMSFQWRGGNYYRAECIDLGTMEKIYNPATDNSIYDVTSKRIEDFLQEGIQNEVEKVEMPQIRFVSMPCDGWFGFVNWEEINGEQNTSEENLKFTIEIVSGTLQVGDAIQLCRMSKYSGSTSYAPNGTKKYHPPKRKLRRLFEYTITEEDLEKRFITFEVPWNDKKAIKLFTVWATSGVNDKTIYFRIRRPKGQINSGSNGGGMTVDAEFSNVVSIRCLSYCFEWYPNDEITWFYQIRIT